MIASMIGPNPIRAELALASQEMTPGTKFGLYQIVAIAGAQGPKS